ncbi:hypothetical protein sm9_1734 [Methanobrevibacter millerae]|jgi:hypothetical protein|uniref:Uncharacterized protein n=1 Tax=Methanobrevibacter millerae TaxID=230361 RepID=A0A0U3ELQ1_9EURY|nr:hypothetical protein sm9_1734 [Methanobrevibacter millerae]
MNENTTHPTSNYHLKKKRPITKLKILKNQVLLNIKKKLYAT